MPVIETQNLSHTYSPGTPFVKEAITDISVKIEKGDLLGIIGHTGSGKSTLVQHFNGLLRPTSGKVFLNGRDIWEKPKKIREVRFKVGLVFSTEHQLLRRPPTRI